ncbi:MAG: hypothetical protein VKP62_01295 [Candidatus Sericytochromatia bacterium]|nr:hypothetical protein [Candidatus Sericytochromatia bacterium]
MSAITPIVQAARKGLVEAAEHAAPSVRRQVEAAAERVMTADAVALSRQAAATATKAESSFMRRVLVALGLLRPNAEESKFFIEKLLLDRGAGFPVMGRHYDLQTHPFKDNLVAFATKAERWDPSVPYASQERPLTLLGTFDTESRTLRSLKAINRTPAKHETYERIFMEQRPREWFEFFWPRVQM